MRCQADAATTRRLGVSPGRRILPSLSYRCVIVDDGNGPSCSEAFRQIRRVYRIRYFSDDSASIYWWGGEGGKINVEKYRFTVYLFTQVYETWDERMRRNLKFESVELDGIYINIYRLARILLARSSIRSFIYRLGYSISLFDNFSSVILITMKN